MRCVSLSLLLFLSCPGAVSAQTDTISLEQALQRGQSGRPELRSAALQVRLAENRNAGLRAQWRPQVQASGDFRVNTQLQKSVIPVGAFGLPGVPADATRTVAFGVPFQNLAALDVSQKIYDARHALDRQLNDAGTQARQLEREQAERDIRRAITEAYYDLMWQNEKVRYAQAALQRAETAVEYETARKNNGAARPNDYNRALLDRNTAELNRVQAVRGFEDSADYLKYLMADTSQNRVYPAETLEAFAAGLEKQPRAAGENRLELRLEENARQQNALLERRERLRFRPEVSAFGNYSVLALDDQLSTFNYLGLRATLPLYDGRLARLAAEDYRLQQQINVANLDKLRNDIRYDLASSERALASCSDQTRACAQNVALARQIFENSQHAFQEGAIVLNDLKTDELALQAAELRYLECLHDWMLAAFAYGKAQGVR